jgi:hypothetical protein
VTANARLPPKWEIGVTQLKERKKRKKQAEGKHHLDDFFEKKGEHNGLRMV